MVYEANHRLQAAISSNSGKVTAGDHHLPTLRSKCPRKTEPVVVGIHIVERVEAKACKTFLHRLDHGVDPGMAVATHQRVEIATLLCPSFGNQGAAAGGIALIPGG